MSLITRRDEAQRCTRLFRERNASMAIFCTASHWNTEAILLAGQRIAEKYHLATVPLAVAMTFTYPYMPQAKRITYSGDPRVGFLSNMGHLQALAGPDSPYPNVAVLPHLDHADPQRDKWALTEGLPYLATVMFDAQKYPFEDNVTWTRDYVATYGQEVLVEGIIEELSVAGRAQAVQRDEYVEKAVRYMADTHVDLLVADLGTEQQSDRVGEACYLKDRARELTASLGEARLVLHGTSCLTLDQMQGLASDGVIRVNMWTRIAREAGQHAARQLIARQDAIAAGDFEASESRQYLYDSIEQAAGIMVEVMETIGYPNLGT
ncbi:MAG: class II fructose-bisphosphate aldolase [Chloroflexi bacterium]|nr:class II fructose-bisphosphate aldolase [Chloroflexota bacterium]